MTPDSRPGPPYPPLLSPRSFEHRYDVRSFGEPISKLRAIPVLDCAEPLVDLREACPKVILHPGCLPLLRRTVAEMVSNANAALPAGHTLTVGTCLRTPKMQQDIRDSFATKAMIEHPDWSPATLNRMLNRVIAPLNPKAPAPHTTGGALDVGVRGEDGTAVVFAPKDGGWAYAPTYHHGLDPEIRDNRIMLITAMESAGLTNYLGEWWHWSYGDQGWALRVGAAVSFYGPVEVENAEELRVPEEEKKE